MSERRSPTIRRRRLGQQLRRLRDEAGVTIEAVAERMECSASKISRIETGHTSASPRDVRDMCGIYGASEAHTEELVQCAREAKQKGWWHPYGDVMTGGYVGLEDGACAVRAYEQQVVPGLLQTEDYARAMLRGARPELTDENIDRRIRVRSTRQSLLNQDGPFGLWVVLDEAVMSRPVGGDDIMRAQLQHLVESASLPNVTLQVLPFAAGAHAAMDGSFSVLSFPDGDPHVVYAENATGGFFLEKSDEIEKYVAIFDHVREVAMNPEESVALIENVIEEPLWKWRPRGSAST